MAKELKLKSIKHSDTLYIKIKKKSLLITAIVDNCGTEFEIDKKELRLYLE